MQACSRNPYYYRIQCIPTESQANAYTKTAIGAVNLIVKPSVQLGPNCVESKTGDTEQVAPHESIVACATQTVEKL